MSAEETIVTPYNIRKSSVQSDTSGNSTPSTSLNSDASSSSTVGNTTNVRNNSKPLSESIKTTNTSDKTQTSTGTTSNDIITPVQRGGSIIAT